jgi:hypothetical protein
METLENIAKTHPNDFDLGRYLRSKKEEFKNPHLNLAMEIYPNDEDLGNFIRNLGNEDSFC